MTTKVVQTVTVPFAEGQNKPTIQITPHPMTSGTDFGIPLRCYPPGCTIVCSVGQIRLKTIRQVEIQGQMMQWSGTSQKLKFYPVGSPTVDLVYGFSTVDGHLMNAGEVTFTVDLVLGEIRSTADFQGLVKVGVYDAQYQWFMYEPKIQYQGAGWAGMDGVNIQFGSVAAFKDGGLTIYEVPAPEFPNADDFIEIYRIVSPTIITVDGEWEKPQSWDSSYTGTYTTGQTGPDKDNSAEKQRVHEVGYITKTTGTFGYTNYLQSLVKPFAPYLIHSTGTQDFQPVISIKEQQLTTVFADNNYLMGLAQGYLTERKTKPLVA